MNTPFFKYHGAGNDFVLIDDRLGIFRDESASTIRSLCDRHFGIGGDGLILIRNHPEVDFEMVYYNSDGAPSSMCGNGGRCAVAFAHRLGMISEKCEFMAVDGVHRAELKPNDSVKLKMTDVKQVEKSGDAYILDTGSPHYVMFVPDVGDIDLTAMAKAIRYNDRFAEEGINVNFVAESKGDVFIRTYERGVEAETLACGTGVTAAALALHFAGKTQRNSVELNALGGTLNVTFDETDDGYENIWKTGPTQLVFEGTIDLP